MKSIQIASTVFILLILTSCKDKTPSDPAPVDPARCKVVDLGDAVDLIEKGSIDDNRMVIVQGISDPRALVWQDDAGKQTFYIARVMGTEQRLFYYKRLALGEKPGISSEFEGYLLRWDRMPKKEFGSVKAALKAKYDIDVKADQSYVINADGKPVGCK